MINSKVGFCFRYEVKKTNNKGLGVFASEPVKRGSVVWRHVPEQYQVYDEALFRSSIEKLSDAEVAYELTHIFGLEEFPGCLIRILDDGVLINHSINGNLITNRAGTLQKSPDDSSRRYLQNVTHSLLDDRYALIATRDIAKGEEFTNDYTAETFDPPYYDALCEQYFVKEMYIEDDAI